MFSEREEKPVDLPDLGPERGVQVPVVLNSRNQIVRLARYHWLWVKIQERVRAGEDPRSVIGGYTQQFLNEELVLTDEESHTQPRGFSRYFLNILVREGVYRGDVLDNTILSIDECYKLLERWQKERGGVRFNKEKVIIFLSPERPIWQEIESDLREAFDPESLFTDLTHTPTRVATYKGHKLRQVVIVEIINKIIAGSTIEKASVSETWEYNFRKLKRGRLPEYKIKPVGE